MAHHPAAIPASNEGTERIHPAFAFPFCHIVNDRLGKLEVLPAYNRLMCPFNNDDILTALL
jgi:hypothetical protein